MRKKKKLNILILQWKNIFNKFIYYILYFNYYLIYKFIYYKIIKFKKNINIFLYFYIIYNKKIYFLKTLITLTGTGELIE